MVNDSSAAVARLAGLRSTSTMALAWVGSCLDCTTLFLAGSSCGAPTRHRQTVNGMLAIVQGSKHLPSVGLSIVE